MVKFSHLLLSYPIKTNVCMFVPYTLPHHISDRHEILSSCLVHFHEYFWHVFAIFNVSDRGNSPLSNVASRNSIRLSVSVLWKEMWTHLITMTTFPMGKNCLFKKKRSPTNGFHKWETIWKSTESVEHNVNGLRQTDIRISLRDKSFRSWNPFWDPFEGEKWR